MSENIPVFFPIFIKVDIVWSQVFYDWKQKGRKMAILTDFNSGSISLFYA